jgi:hypothetical protein
VVRAKAKKLDGSTFRTACPEPVNLGAAVLWPKAQGKKQRTAAKQTKPDILNRGFTVTSPLRTAG